MRPPATAPRQPRASGARPLPTSSTPEFMNATFLRHVKEDDARSRWPTAPLTYRDADKVLAFAGDVLSRDPTSLSNIPGHLLLGQQISTRHPAITPEEATALWHMLQRLNHLVTLNLEDGDGILKGIPTTEIEAATLSLPQLQYLTYRMMYSVELCRFFLSVLRDAPLEKLTLDYPYDLDEVEEAHPPGLLLLLSNPCCANLDTLMVRGLQHEHLYTSSPAEVRRYPRVKLLTLEFTIANPFMRQDIVPFLTFFPNVSDLTIEVNAPPFPVNSMTTSHLNAICQSSSQAQAALPRPFQLADLSASLLDIFLLRVPCPGNWMLITSIDMYSVTAAVDLMSVIFRGVAPRRLSVVFKQDLDTPQVALRRFVVLLRAYWAAFSDHGIPRELWLDVCVSPGADLYVTLMDALALAYSNPRLETFRINIRLQCQSYHPGAPRQSGDSSDDSDDGPRRLPWCAAWHDFMDLAQGLMQTPSYAGPLAQAQQNGLQFHAYISSYCESRWGRIPGQRQIHE